jgi:cell division protein FtsQ
MLNKTKFKKILTIALWVILAGLGVALLIYGVNKKNNMVCKGLKVEIDGERNDFFIDKQDVIEIVESVVGKDYVGKPSTDFNLSLIEKQLKKDSWINKAELYFDNNGFLIAQVDEKQPVARVFAETGNSFYIDEALNMLPLSSRHAARLPVFTNFPSGLKVLAKNDSALLGEVKSMSIYIQKDTFLMAMIDQVSINSFRHFELTPKIGDQTILFGDTEEMGAKFEKLKLFYKKVIPNNGWKKYNKINLEYKGQIVATIRGVEDVISDSLRTMQMMKVMADYSAKMSADTSQSIVQDDEKNTTDISFINQSIPREDAEESGVEVIEKPATAIIQAPVKTNTAKITKVENSANKTASVQKKNVKPEAKKETPKSKVDVKPKVTVKKNQDTKANQKSKNDY